MEKELILKYFLEHDVKNRTFQIMYYNNNYDYELLGWVSNLTIDDLIKEIVLYNRDLNKFKVISDDGNKITLEYIKDIYPIEDTE